MACIVNLMISIYTIFNKAYRVRSVLKQAGKFKKH